jgi:hypothetical protein
MIGHRILGRLVGTATVAASMVASICLATPAQAAPSFDWVNARITLPWTTAPLPDGTLCPGARLKFTGIGESTPSVGLATKGNFSYVLQVLPSGDVTGDGKTDTVIRLACTDAQLENGMSWVYLYTTKHNKPVLLDFITASDDRANVDFLVYEVVLRLGEIDVTQGVRGLSEFVVRTFSWDGSQLTADRPLPLFPEADIAP